MKGLAISPDRQWMVSASFDYTVVVWTTNSIAAKSTLYGHEAAVNVAAFSPDGSQLATAGDDGLILLWDMAEVLADPDSAEPHILSGHKRQGCRSFLRDRWQYACIGKLGRVYRRLAAR